MGSCFSVSLPCDQVVNQVTSFLCVKMSFIHNLKENLAALETTVEVLKAKRDDLLRRVENQENKGRQRLAEVQVWLTRVETIEIQVSDLLNVRTTELRRLCLCGFCTKSLKLSLRYGKRVSMMLKEVENLQANGFSDVVVEKAQASEVVERPVQPAIGGRGRRLEIVWNCLMEDGVSIMGLFGMGGVGKTTLLTHINNEFLKTKDAFDIVIWIVVSKDLQIKKIQEDIAKKLGLDGEDWNQKDKVEKACAIHNVLKRKKFVLLLDDIWEKVNLMEVGVPYLSKENGCKVVFTTRSLEVCGRMGADVEMVVQCLPPDDALELFKKKVGEITLRSDPNIPELASLVAKKCQGLPLALSVIGETMACKRTIQEWEHAIDVLSTYAAEFSGMEDEILTILKFSYENLKGEHVKLCFLYCALFPENHRIFKLDLIEYWICEGFIDESIGVERAVKKGYEIIGSLIGSSLLMEYGSYHVYMHDVVREMALWIASDFRKQKDNFIVQAGIGLNKIPKVQNWNIVRRMSLMSNKFDRISSSLDCLELKTLFLHQNQRLASISGAFFMNMPRLVLLNLSGNRNLYELPDEISQLVSLKYLNMSNSSLQCLPVGFRKLKVLTHLNLDATENLSSAVGISALLNLKVVKLWKSKVSYDLNTVKELRVLEHLEILTLSISCDSGLDQFLSSHNLMRCTKVLQINGLQLDSSEVSLLASMDTLFLVTLNECTFYEKKMDSEISIISNMVPLHNPTHACFLSLSNIFILGSKCLKDLTWLMFAPNLRVLYVEGGDELEDLIQEEKTIACEGSGFVPFRRLESLQLINLPELKNIYWRPLRFPFLMEICIEECPKLRKLPLNSESGPSGEKGMAIKYKGREWLEGIEWEDEATKARFLPSCIEGPWYTRPGGRWVK
ncbi:unnamed protein product [Brassica oleracea]